MGSEPWVLKAYGVKGSRGRALWNGQQVGIFFERRGRAVAKGCYVLCADALHGALSLIVRHFQRVSHPLPPCADAQVLLMDVGGGRKGNIDSQVTEQALVNHVLLKGAESSSRKPHISARSTSPLMSMGLLTSRESARRSRVLQSLTQACVKYDEHSRAHASAKRSAKSPQSLEY